MIDFLGIFYPTRDFIANIPIESESKDEDLRLTDAEVGAQGLADVAARERDPERDEGPRFASFLLPYF
jgi:hypothetical protein